MARCDVCFRHCELNEGQMGFCLARKCKDGKVGCDNYGKLTALALDPIEKKPLNRFYPGSMILSLGSYGCNLRCPFCQNDDISWADVVKEYPAQDVDIITPEELVKAALKYKDEGNIGIAFTYNEPLVGYEFVRDTAKLIHEAGMKNVLVSNGTAELSVLKEIGPYIDAMNIDLKGITERYYTDVLKGDLNMVKAFITEAVKICHVELTTLIVPNENDTEDEMRQIVSFISSLSNADGDVIGSDIPLHISRFFPRFKMRDRDATDVALIYHLADIARERLNNVYTGNC